MGKRIGKVVTRTGDSGTTGLASGARLSKAAPRIELMGEVDELNATLGWLRAAGQGGEVDALLAEVQQQLFQIGGELALGGDARLLGESAVVQLEEALESLNRLLPPLEEFILPAGGERASRCHIARAVCRRVERRWVSLAEAGDDHGTLNPDSGRYLNRLSDYLFVLARHCSKDETHWRGSPGESVR
ncbi:MAG: cob(I)yrinic acid a,c-diamide adenosyltransferase [Pseudomonadota bacterium]